MGTIAGEVTVYRDSEVVYYPHWIRADDTLIANSAGGAFPKPRVEHLTIGIIHVIKLDDGYTDTNYKNELNACNNATWHQWEAGEAWISRIITEDETWNGQDVTKVHYVIRCNEFGWNSHMPQMGYFYLEGGAKKKFDEGMGFLNGSGGELPVGDPPIDSDDEIKRRISFASIGY